MKYRYSTEIKVSNHSTTGVKVNRDVSPHQLIFFKKMMLKDVRNMRRNVNAQFKHHGKLHMAVEQ